MNSENTVRLYKVTDGDAYEALSVLVWAETPSKAKAVGYKSDWLEPDKYTNLRASLQLWTGPAGPAGTQATNRVHRLLGWYAHEDAEYSPTASCDGCGLHEWPDVLESILCNGCYHCLECGIEEDPCEDCADKVAAYELDNA